MRHLKRQHKAVYVGSLLGFRTDLDFKLTNDSTKQIRNRTEQ